MVPSFLVLANRGITAIAFAAISIGVYSYPLSEAAAAMSVAIGNFFPRRIIDRSSKIGFLLCQRCGGVLETSRLYKIERREAEA